MAAQHSTWEETKALFIELRRTGDAAIRERLILENMPLAKMIASKFWEKKRPKRLDRDDFINVAYYQLIKATDNFDPSLGFRFTSYVGRCVARSLISLYSQQGGATPLSNYAAVTLNTFKSEQRRRRNDALPADRESVFKALGWLQGRAEFANGLIDAVHATWYGGDVLEPTRGDPSSLAEMVPDREPSDEPERRLAAKSELKRLMRRLTPKEKSVVRLRYGLTGRDPMLLAAVNRELGFGTDRHANWVHHQAVGKLRKAAG